jgi:hypothetical protein
VTDQLQDGHLATQRFQEEHPAPPQRLEEREREIEQLNLELAETKASDLKSRFLSYMSHEFRTPLGRSPASCGFFWTAWTVLDSYARNPFSRIGYPCADVVIGPNREILGRFAFPNSHQRNQSSENSSDWDASRKFVRMINGSVLRLALATTPGWPASDPRRRSTRFALLLPRAHAFSGPLRSVTVKSEQLHVPDGTLF